MPAASVATARTLSFTDFAFFSRFLALPVSLILTLALPESVRVSVPMTVGFLPSLSFFAVFLSTTSWSLSVHGSVQAAVTARPLASTALSFCLAAFSVAAGAVVSGPGPPPAGGSLGLPGVPPPGGAGLAVIVTVLLDVAVRPSSSLARTATVWLPGVSKRRESVRPTPVCTAVPSTVKRYSSIVPSASLPSAVKSNVLPSTAFARSTASETAGGASTASVTVAALACSSPSEAR